MIYKDKRVVWLFLLPTLAFLVMFLYGPFIAGIGNSLCQITDITGYGRQYIGFANYAEMAKDPYIRIALKNTFIMMIFTVVFEAGLGFVFALFVDSIKRGQKFYRTVFFFPVVISATAIGLMFFLFYAYQGGLLNQLINKFGGEPVLWLDEAKTLYMIAIPTVWQYVGFYFVIVLTGIAAIPEDIYESAYLDGITGFKKTLYITIPLLKGVIKSCLVLVITGTLKIFDMAWIIAPKGAPYGSSYLLGTYQYNMIFEGQRVGYASAIAVLIVVLGVTISLFVNACLKEDDY